MKKIITNYNGGNTVFLNFHDNDNYEMIKTTVDYNGKNMLLV
jgi:hypothetical protein